MPSPAGLSDDPIPAFGREQARDHQTLRWGSSHVVVLDEGAYLMRLGQACWGCCAYSDPIVILHTLRDGALAPAASVFLAEERGPLEVPRARGPEPGN